MTPLSKLAAITQPPVLGAEDVHVWYCFYDELRDPGQLAAFEKIMTDDERARHQRLHFARDRHMFLVTVITSYSIHYTKLYDAAPTT